MVYYYYYYYCMLQFIKFGWKTQSKRNWIQLFAKPKKQFCKCQLNFASSHHIHAFRNLYQNWHKEQYGTKNKGAIAGQCESNVKLIAAVLSILYSHLIWGDSPKIAFFIFLSNTIANNLFFNIFPPKSTDLDSSYFCANFFKSDNNTK